MTTTDELFANVEAALAGEQPAARTLNLLAAGLSSGAATATSALAGLRRARDRVTSYDAREAAESLTTLLECAAGERGRKSLIYYRLAVADHRDADGRGYADADEMFRRYLRNWPLEPPPREAFDAELAAVRAKLREGAA